MKSFVISLSLVFVVALLTSGNDHAQKTDRQVIELPNRSLRNEVKEQFKQNPKMSAAEVTAYANSLLMKKGFDYEFDTLGFIKKHQLNPLRSDAVKSTYQYLLEQGSGEKFTLQCQISEGMCGELFACLPARRVTEREILLLVNGKEITTRRPKDFGLDVMELVESTARKSRVIRRWEVPEQAVPAGISADGKTLYLPADFDRFSEMPGLNGFSVIAVSPAGIRFEIAQTALAGQRTTRLTSFPKDPQNGYLGFTKFRRASQTYLIRYTNPCS